MTITFIEALFKKILPEVSDLMAAAYAQAEVIHDDHPLSQEGLANGTSIVFDYLEHNEAKIALEHLLYMVNEPPLKLSAHSEQILSQLCEIYGLQR